MAIDPKPMGRERLAEVREIAEHPSPRQLVETALIRELVDDRERQAQKLDRLRENLQSLARRWHEEAAEHWHGEGQTEARSGKGDGLSDCAEEINKLLAEVFGG